MILLSHLPYAAYLCVLLASVLATDTNDPSVHNQTSSHLIPRSRSRRIYFEVALNLAFGEGPSSGPVNFPVKSAIWIEGSPLEVPLKIDLRLVRFPSHPSFTMFTPYVQELFFEFPHLPPATYRIGDWLTVEPGVEIFTCGETHVSNTDIMSIVDGKGILLNRIKSDAVLSTALVDPNIFMYDLLLDLVTASEWRYERLLHHIIDSRNFFKQKNPAWVALMPLAVYQAGNDGKYSRFFDIRDAEQPKGLDSGQRPAFIDSVANEVMPDAQNPYIASWETVGVGSTATPPNWRPYDILDFLNLGYFPTPDRNPT